VPVRSALLGPTKRIKGLPGRTTDQTIGFFASDQSVSGLLEVLSDITLGGSVHGPAREKTCRNGHRCRNHGDRAERNCSPHHHDSPGDTNGCAADNRLVPLIGEVRAEHERTRLLTEIDRRDLDAAELAQLPEALGFANGLRQLPDEIPPLGGDDHAVVLHARPHAVPDFE
jgi:hypothetical protein